MSAAVAAELQPVARSLADDALQTNVEWYMARGELFGSAVIRARRELGLPDAHLVTRADLDRRPR